MSTLITPNPVSEKKVAEEMELLSAGRAASRVNRRNFLSTLGIAAGAAGTIGMIGCNDNQTPVATPAAATISIADVFNFALNLEYLEAQFYLYITTGGGLATADMGTSPGTVTGGAKATLTNPRVIALAQNLAADEQLHVQFLRSTISAIGGTPVSMPSLNLAALGAVTNDATFLAAARQLETVGISAYAGAASYLVGSTAAITYAAQILDTEAQHEGFLRQLCLELGVTSGAVDTMDTPPTATVNGIFNTDKNTGLNPVRTPSQVLQIVYAAAGKTGVASGGFYPVGLNGTIKTT